MKQQIIFPTKNKQPLGLMDSNTIEPPSEPFPTPFNAHMAIADPCREYEDQDQPDPIGKTEKPAHWNQMSATAKTNWRRRNKK